MARAVVGLHNSVTSELLKVPLNSQVGVSRGIELQGLYGGMEGFLSTLFAMCEPEEMTEDE